MATPGDPEGPLWAGRVKIGSEAWAAAGVLHIEPLPPHRHLYLTFEGELSGGRGTVKRVDQGMVEPVGWIDVQIIVRVSMQRFHGLIELNRAGEYWIGRVT